MLHSGRNSIFWLRLILSFTFLVRPGKKPIELVWIAGYSAKTNLASGAIPALFRERVLAPML